MSYRMMMLKVTLILQLIFFCIINQKSLILLRIFFMVDSFHMWPRILPVDGWISCWPVRRSPCWISASRTCWSLLTGWAPSGWVGSSCAGGPISIASVSLRSRWHAQMLQDILDFAFTRRLSTNRRVAEDAIVECLLSFAGLFAWVILAQGDAVIQIQMEMLKRSMLNTQST